MNLEKSNLHIAIVRFFSSFFLNAILCFKSTNLKIKMADNDQNNTF